MATLIGNEALSTQRRGQVYLATHEGEDRLPFMRRSFISFSFGGRLIEDFNLIATFSSDRMNRSGYAPFEDTVTNYNNLNGQYYWSTHYKPNTLELNLSTDGITQQQLDDFLYWFQAGVTRELILAEHPNRAILARVSDPPQLEVLPFEMPVEVQLYKQSYNTSTTLYKGDISLSFVMDQPFWYAKVNLLGKFNENNSGQDIYYDQWIDVNGKTDFVFNNKDALKIIHEDGIPIGDMIKNDMLLGDGTYASLDIQDYNRIFNGSVGAYISGIVDGVTYLGMIAGTMISQDGTVIISGNDNTAYPKYTYFYYAGTAPAFTKISFTVDINYSDSNYIYTFSNRFRTNNDLPYSTITIESTEKQELHLTTPNIFTSYNDAIEIFNKNIGPGSSKTWDDIRALLRDNVHHASVRAWANHVLDETITYYSKPERQITPNLPDDSTDLNAIKATDVEDRLENAMKGFFGIINQDDTAQATFVFNSETGEASGTFNYMKSPTDENLSQITEDVGDMLRSNQLVIRERNYPTSNNDIMSWTSAHKQYSHCIHHNVRSPLYDFSIIYKNMYL